MLLEKACQLYKSEPLSCELLIFNKLHSISEEPFDRLERRGGENELAIDAADCSEDDLGYLNLLFQVSLQFNESLYLVKKLIPYKN